MMFAKSRIALLAACASTSLAVAAPAAIAGEKTSNHTLGSGEHIYRVEIRNLNRLEVLEAGDKDGVGELHAMHIELSAYNYYKRKQYHRHQFTGTELYSINKGGIVGGRRYFPIRAGQHVFTASDRRPNTDTQLWVHVYSNPDDAEHMARTPDGNGSRVSLTITAQELDCVGQRVCGRRSSGGVTVHFRIPEFATQPSNRCGPDNTFRLEKLDGEIQVSGLSNTSIFSYANSSTLIGGIDHKKGGPRLQPFNADICIASTVRPSAN